jgi:hypothetical protein
MLVKDREQARKDQPEGQAQADRHSTHGQNDDQSGR